MAPPLSPVEPASRLDVEPPRGVPVQPRQEPNRRFFPTTPGVAPMINNNRANDR